MTMFPMYLFVLFMVAGVIAEDLCKNPEKNKPFASEGCKTLSAVDSCRLAITNLLFDAADCDLEALKKHKSSGMDMGLMDYDKRAALHVAAAEGHLKCVEYLLNEAKVDPNPKDRWGSTPMDEAKKFGKKEVEEALKKGGGKSGKM